MPNQVSSAVILAAGRGTRMGSMTQEVPKPMLLINGKPMLQHILERLSEAGIQRFLIVVGYHRAAIERHFAHWPVPVQFALQAPVNGTGSAALLARDFAADEPFLLTFGDIVCDAREYANCIQILQSNDTTEAVLAVKWVDDPWQGAAVYEQSGRLTRIVEKPPKGTSSSHWNSAGIYSFRPSVFSYLAELKLSQRNEYELTSALENMLAANLDLRISPIAGDWRDVGRPEDLAAVNDAP